MVTHCRTEHNIPFAANAWEMNKIRQVSPPPHSMQLNETI